MRNEVEDGEVPFYLSEGAWPFSESDVVGHTSGP